MACASNQRFRFPDLPKERRLLAYTFLPDRIVRTKYAKSLHTEGVTSFTLISTFAPRAILGTCRMVKEEADRPTRSIAERSLHGPMPERLDNRLSFPGPRIEVHYRNLEFMALQGGLIEAVAKWVQRLRQHHLDRVAPCFEAWKYLSRDILSLNGYVVEHWTAEQGYLCVVDFVQKAGWALYHLSQNCSLDKFRVVDRYSSLSALMRIALSQRDADTPSEYYRVVTNLADSIEELESTFGVGFLLPSLNTSSVRRKQSEESWEALVWAISDLFHGGEMYQGLHGLVIEGVFELDQADPGAYKEYWCEGE